MADWQEIMAAERSADDSAHAARMLADHAGDPGQMDIAKITMLDAIRLEIRAQGMRIDRTLATKI